VVLVGDIITPASEIAADVANNTLTHPPGPGQASTP